MKFYHDLYLRTSWRPLQHIRHLLPFSTAQTLACSLILSRLDYCNAVLYGCSAGAIGRLQRVQNYAVRVVTQSNRYTPSQPLLQSLQWLPVQQRLDYKAALITYKVITTSTSSYLNDLLAVHIPAGPTRRSSTRPMLTVPYVASNFARQSFRFVSPTVWNSLPSDVRSSPSQATFKSRLKTHLFNIAFNDQLELWCCVTSSAPQDLWHWHLARYKLDYYLLLCYMCCVLALSMGCCELAECQDQHWWLVLWSPTSPSLQVRFTAGFLYLLSNVMFWAPSLVDCHAVFNDKSAYKVTHFYSTSHVQQTGLTITKHDNDSDTVSCVAYKLDIFPVVHERGEVLAWLPVWSKVQMIYIWSSWGQCHLIISCSSNIQNGLPFWCRLTHVVFEKRPLNGCCSSSSSSSSSTWL